MQTGRTTVRIQHALDRIAADQDLTFARNDLAMNTELRIRKLVRKALRTQPSVSRWEGEDDIVQMVLTQMDRAVRRMKPTSPRLYFSIAAHAVRCEIINLLRKYQGPAGMGTHHHSGAHPAPAANRLDTTGYTIDPIAVHEAVDRLDEHAREAWQLCMYLGMSQKVASEQLGVSAKTIQRRIARARNLLASELDRLRPGA